MHVIALPCEFLPVLKDAETTIYKVISTTLEGHVHLFFDENMCIDLDKCPEVIDKLRTVFRGFEYKIIDKQTLYFLAAEITAVLQWCRSMGCLYTGSMYEFMKNYHSMLLLHSKDYELAKIIWQKR